jgi:polyphosphate kinase
MRPLTAALACLIAAPLATPAAAHPHVFVDTTLHFRQNDAGEVVEVEVTWAYDDFFSLLILEDLGLDPDGDAQLTEREFQELWAFDLENWYEGFEGDLYLYGPDGAKLPLGDPRATRIDMRDGMIVAGHRRAVPPTDPAGLEILQYDPTFYVAYELSGGVSFDRDCDAQVVEADMEAAMAARDAALDEALTADGEDIFETVELGIHFADRVVLTCDAPS